MKKKINEVTLYQWAKLIIVSVCIGFGIWYISTCKGCGEKPRTENLKPVSQEHLKVFENNEKEYKELISVLEKENSRLKIERDASDAKLTEFINYYNDSETVIDKTLLSDVPDTCKKIQMDLTAKFNRLKDVSFKKDREFSKNISILNMMLSNKEKKSLEDSIQLEKQKKLFNECISSLRKFENTPEKKERSELRLGISAIGNYAGVLNPAAGVQVEYRSKKGLEVGLSVFTNQIGVITVSKRLTKLW